VISRLVKAAGNSLKTANELSADCGLKVSRWTIARALKKSEVIVRQKMKVASRLLDRHKEARVKFARNNMATGEV